MLFIKLWTWICIVILFSPFKLLNYLNLLQRKTNGPGNRLWDRHLQVRFAHCIALEKGSETDLFGEFSWKQHLMGGKAVGSRRGKHETMMQSQQRPQLVAGRALKLGWPCLRTLHCLSGLWCGSTWGENAAFLQGSPWAEDSSLSRTELWGCSTRCPQALGHECLCPEGAS